MKVVLDCTIIHILLITENTTGEVSPAGPQSTMW